MQKGIDRRILKFLFLFFLIPFSQNTWAGVYDEFAPVTVETKYDAWRSAFLVRPLWYLGGVYPFFISEIAYSYNEEIESSLHLGGGINDSYGFNLGSNFNYKIFIRANGYDAFGLGFELWWDDSHKETLEKSIALSWTRFTKASEHSGFVLGLEALLRSGKGFRSRPAGFFNQIAVSPFSLGLKLGYSFSWSEIKKFKEVQRLNQF